MWNAGAIPVRQMDLFPQFLEPRVALPWPRALQSTGTTLSAHVDSQTASLLTTPTAPWGCSKGAAKKHPQGSSVSSQKPRRPPNPWILYCADKYKELKDGKVTPKMELALIQTGLWRLELIRGTKDTRDPEPGAPWAWQMMSLARDQLNCQY